MKDLNNHNAEQNGVSTLRDGPCQCLQEGRASTQLGDSRTLHKGDSAE